jgi:hypothetical protein
MHICGHPMGNGAMKGVKLCEVRHDFKFVSYYEDTNCIMVVYGPNITPADAIVTDKRIPGTRTELLSLRDTICVMKHEARIDNAGVIRMGTNEAMLHMEDGARIQAHPNARLKIDGMLIMEKDSSFILEPGASFVVRRSLHIASGATLRIAEGVACEHVFETNLTESFTVSRDHTNILAHNHLTVTWCEADKDFLQDLMHFLCHRHGLPQEVILPWVLPLVCQRYGTLMMPAPYRMPTTSVLVPKILKF